MDREFRIRRLDDFDSDFMSELAANLRQQDIDEMNASDIKDYLTEINNTVKFSEDCYKVLAPNGAVIAGFGVINTTAGGQIWFLGTDLIKQFRKSFVKISSEIIKKWLKEYGRLFNYVSAQNTESIKWLRFMGAKLEKKHIYKGHVFIMFEIERVN